MKITRITLAMAIIAFFTNAVNAVELPELFSDNMVLQQNSEAKMWGWTKPQGEVVITPSWSATSQTVKADKSGKWVAQVVTPAASFAPQSITFKDTEAITLNNVLIGEVWFCSGQSNMEMPLNGFWTQPIENSNKTIAYSGKYKGIRMVTIPKNEQLKPITKTTGKWKESNPENAQWFSAVGYHFAVALTEMLNVPVGIINCSWGGSRVEGWMPEAQLDKYPDVDIKECTDESITQYHRPMIMYNGMLAPVAGYTVKGFLWNQGESNVGKDNTYAQRLADMVEIWRGLWNDNSLPFYTVEIPPHIYGGVDGVESALLRTAQHDATKLIANSGIVSTSDLVYPYELHDIHPCKKQEIGERLAFMAMGKTYGTNGIAYESPTFKDMRIEGNTAILTFNNAPDGLTPNRNIKGFEVAGYDKVFYPADAREIGETLEVKVSSEMVKDIKSVRYCYKNFAVGQLWNIRGLPLVTFRTDNW